MKEEARLVRVEDRTMSTIRLTAAQAMMRWLSVQMISSYSNASRHFTRRSCPVSSLLEKSARSCSCSSILKERVIFSSSSSTLKVAPEASTSSVTVW